MKVLISYSIDSSLKRKLDKVRGDIPRSKFIARLVESYINNEANKINPINENKIENINPPEDTFQVEQLTRGF